MATQIIRQRASIPLLHNGGTRREGGANLFSKCAKAMRKYFGPGHLYYLNRDHQGNLSAKEKAIIDACRFGISFW